MAYCHGVRRSAQETRDLLISTGIEMLMEQGATAGVAHVRLKAVVDRAGLTTGAAYRLWNDQDHYHGDLAIAATLWREDRPVSTTIAAIRSLVDAGAPLDEVIRIAAAAHIASLTTSPGATDDGRPIPPHFLTSVALRATTCSDPDLRAANLQRHRDQVGHFIELYDKLMGMYGRRCKPPHTVELLASTLAALGEGFALQVNEGEHHPMVCGLHPDLDAEWTTFGLAVKAVVDGFTEPVRD